MSKYELLRKSYTVTVIEESSGKISVAYHYIEHVERELANGEMILVGLRYRSVNDSCEV
jgi:hypothetical protein